jgi:predicted membrane protein
VGLIVGRWWALAAAVGVGVWIALVSEVEVSAWFLGVVYGALAAVGIAAGILLRRSVKRPVS